MLYFRSTQAMSETVVEKCVSQSGDKFIFSKWMVLSFSSLSFVISKVHEINNVTAASESSFTIILSLLL